MSKANALLFIALILPWIPLVIDHFFDKDSY
jgi:hypothetical protein